MDFVIIDKDNTMFRDTSSMTTTTIHGLKLSKEGVIKEHPDLKDDKSVCGEIGDMVWGLRLNEYKKSLEIHKKKPIIKLFGDR